MKNRTYSSICVCNYGNFFNNKRLVLLKKISLFFWNGKDEKSNNCDVQIESCLIPWQVRPVVETGYENLLLVRLLLEMRIPSIQKSTVSIYPLNSDMNYSLHMETHVIISDLLLITLAPVCKYLRLGMMIMLLSARLQRDSQLRVYWRTGQS